jgi:hypothetical protein
MSNVSDIFLEENTHFLFSNFFSKIMPYMRFYPPPHGATAPNAPGPPHCPGLTITHRHTTLGRTLSGREISPSQRLTIHNTQKRQTSVPLAGFEPAIPASERPQTVAVDRAAAAIDRLWDSVTKYGRARQATDDNMAQKRCDVRAGQLRQEYRHADNM